MLHLFAGDSRKEIERKAQQHGFEVLSIGESEDVMSGQTFRYLLSQAASGRFDAIWAAPPCGTNTLCRFVEPGPPPLRSREGEGRWGLPGLSIADRKKVQVADELYLRCLLIMLVAKEGNERKSKRVPWNLLENPQDPEEYLDENSPLRVKASATGGLPSFFATYEFQVAARLLGMKVYAGHQGPYGRVKCKPTGWGSTEPLPPLLKGPGTGVGSSKESSGNDHGKDWPSKSWAKWSEGMINLLIGQLAELKGCEGLCKASVDWGAHIAAGHWPPHRRCCTRIASGARNRAHRRVASPASWTLSLDVVGPFKKACDETDRDLRFALVGCLVVPLDAKLGPNQEHSKSDEDKPSPANEGVDPADDDYDIGAELGLMSIDDPEGLQELPKGDDYESCREQCEADAKGMDAAELSCEVPGLHWGELHFV